MNDLDRELLSAIQNSEATSAELGKQEAPPVSLASVERRKSSGRRGRAQYGLLAALLVVVLGVLSLVFSSAEDAVIYSVTTDKLLADVPKYEGRAVRVEGDLVSGSLRYRAEPCEYRFSIQKGEKTLPVRYEACIVPDTFKDVPDTVVQVTAEGKLTSEGHFQATNIMAKCPSKYEMQERAKKGEAAPHAMTAPRPLESDADPAR